MRRAPSCRVKIARLEDYSFCLPSDLTASKLLGVDEKPRPVLYDIPTMLSRLTGTQAKAWKGIPGPNTRVGVTVYYEHPDRRLAFANLDQEIITIRIGDETLLWMTRRRPRNLTLCKGALKAVDFSAVRGKGLIIHKLYCAGSTAKLTTFLR